VGAFQPGTQIRIGDMSADGQDVGERLASSDP
jgi:hypothetical protein